MSYLCLYNDPEIERHLFCPLKCNLKTTVGSLTTTEAGILTSIDPFPSFPLPFLHPQASGGGTNAQDGRYQVPRYTEYRGISSRHVPW